MAATHTHVAPGGRRVEDCSCLDPNVWPPLYDADRQDSAGLPKPAGTPSTPIGLWGHPPQLPGWLRAAGCALWRALLWLGRRLTGAGRRLLARVRRMLSGAGKTLLAIGGWTWDRLDKFAVLAGLGVLAVAAHGVHPTLGLAVGGLALMFAGGGFERTSR